MDFFFFLVHVLLIPYVLQNKVHFWSMGVLTLDTENLLCPLKQNKRYLKVFVCYLATDFRYSEFPAFDLVEWNSYFFAFVVFALNRSGVFIQLTRLYICPQNKQVFGRLFGFVANETNVLIKDGFCEYSQ